MPIIQDYITHGWQVVPIPPGTKGPNSPGWNKRTGALASESVLPAGYGVGLAHAYSGTMALDVDDWAGTILLGIDVNALAAAPDSVMIHSGKAGHGKLVYRMPFGLVLPTRQVKDGKRVLFELRCGTVDGLTVQDVLPPHVHPETQQPYQWAGNGDWRHLPMLPAPILDFWQDSLKDARPTVTTELDSSWDEIQSALASIDPDCSREDWIHAGMAIKWAGEHQATPDEAYTLWDQWSARGKKYPGQRETFQQWRSFRNDKSQTVTTGRLFYIAAQHGWVRPTLDASALFGDVSEMTPPADIMQSMKPLPPDIDLSLWPSVLSKRAQEVSDSVGCDPIVPLWAGLGAACGTVDAQSRLELMPGFKVPPVLWLMTIGDPGDRKSPGSAPMLDPLKLIEFDDKARYATDRNVWEFNQAVYASAHSTLLKFAGSPDGILAPELAPYVPPEPKQPVTLRFTVNDITSQELLNKCQFRPRGMLAYFDEMNSWVSKITNKMSGENRSAWVVGFEARPYELDRVKNGETMIQHFALSVYGNMQPQVLADSFTNLASDGLLQRFLPAVLRHNKTRLNQPIPDFMTSAATWENCLRLTHSLPAMNYRLAPEAYQAFRRFQEWYEERMYAERLMGSSGEFITAFGKITGLVGRLALMFHILEDPFGSSVTGERMARVIKIARQFIIPSYRYVFDTDGASSAFESWVMEYVIQHADLEKLTLSDVKRSGKRQFEKADVKMTQQKDEHVLSSMYLLEKMKWVARIDDGSKEARGHAEWLINPHLKTTFKAYRDAVVKAKLDRNQDRLDKAHIKHYDARQVTHGADSLDLQTLSTS